MHHRFNGRSHTGSTESTENSRSYSADIAAWTLASALAIATLEALPVKSPALGTTVFTRGGALAGAHAGLQQARSLRLHGLAWRGWMWTNAAGTALAWLLAVVAMLFLTR